MRGSDSLTRAERDQLLKAVEETSGDLALRDHTMLELLGGTGLRVSELVCLRVSQVVEGGVALDMLHLERKNTKRGRGGKLPVSERLQGALVVYVRWLRTWSDGDW